MYSPHLQMDVLGIVANRRCSGAVNDIHADGGLAFGLEHVVDQVLGREVDGAPPVGVMLAQGALRIYAAQAPVGTTSLVSYVCTSLARVLGAKLTVHRLWGLCSGLNVGMQPRRLCTPRLVNQRLCSQS